MKELYSWEAIASEFKEGIVLGNGASIAVHNGFAYSKLFDIALGSGLISDNVKKIFDYFETEDFELVLKLLWHAFYINQALKLEEDSTTKAYKEVRSALIKAVRERHIEYSCITAELGKIYGFLHKFETVASLNYDLIVYWAMLLGNEQLGSCWFRDCFVHGEFSQDWGSFRVPRNGGSGSTLVFYPHGNLALASNIFGFEEKIAADNNSNLLDTIIGRWESGDVSPLFISEGKREQKINAIRRSNYLQVVYDEVLPRLGNNITILGWAFGDQDTHILQAICRYKEVKKLAISIHQEVAGNHQQECEEIEQKIRQIPGGEKIQLCFFDASSGGCWLK